MEDQSSRVTAPEPGGLAGHHVQHLFHGDQLDDLGDRGALVRIQRVEGVQVEGDCRVFLLDRPLERGAHGLGRRMVAFEACEQGTFQIDQE